MHKFFLYYLLLFSFTSTSFGNIDEQKVRQTMNQLSVGIIGNQFALDPILGYNYMDYLLIQCVYQTLVRFSSKGELVGNLVESWTISPDRKVYTFKIKSNLVFSDGSSLSSDDILFSLSRHGWPSSKSIIKGYLSDLIVGYKGASENEIPKGFKKIDSESFQITLSRPYVPFLYVLSMPGFSIVSSNDKRREAWIGSGPLIASKENNKWKFVKNDKYSGPIPSMKNILINSYGTVKEAKEALNNYSVDVLLNLPYTNEHKISLPKEYLFKPTDSLTYQHLFFNAKKNHPISLRKALGSIIGKIASAPNQESDYFVPISRFLPPGVMLPSYYDKKSNLNSEHDERKIKKIILEGVKGKFKILIPKERTSESFLLNLKKELANINPNVQIDEVDLQTFRSELGASNYDLTLFAYIGNYPDPDGFIDSIRENNFPGVNVDSKKLFEALDKIRFITNTEERMKLYQEELLKFEDQWTIVPLFQVKLPFVLSNRIQIPKTKYRYEAELWNFLWEQK